MIKQFISQDVCLKCRGCCRFGQADSVWLPCILKNEIETLSETETASFQISKDKKVIPVFSKQDDSFFCPLLSRQDNKCRIYTRHFFDCRLYPFLINRSNGKIYLSVDLNCRSAGDNYKTGAFDEYARYLLELLESAPFREILTNNPQLIQAYPGVINIEELKIKGWHAA